MATEQIPAALPTCTMTLAAPTRRSDSERDATADVARALHSADCADLVGRDSCGGRVLFPTRFAPTCAA